MLRAVEFTLLAVSLLVVIGLIVSGSRNVTKSSASEPPGLSDDGPEAHDSGKTV